MLFKDVFKDWLSNGLTSDQKFALLKDTIDMNLINYSAFDKMDALDDYFMKPSEALSKIKDGGDFQFTDDIFAVDAIEDRLYSFDLETFLKVNFDTEELAENYMGIRKLDIKSYPWFQMFFDWCYEHDDISLDACVCSMKPNFDLYVIDDFEIGSLGYVFDYATQDWSEAMVIGCGEKEGFEKHDAAEYRGEFVVKQDDGSFKDLMVEFLVTRPLFNQKPPIQPTKFC